MKGIRWTPQGPRWRFQPRVQKRGRGLRGAIAPESYTVRQVLCELTPPMEIHTARLHGEGLPELRESPQRGARWRVHVGKPEQIFRVSYPRPSDKAQAGW